MDGFGQIILMGRRIVLRAVRSSDCSELFKIIAESRPHLEKWLPWVHYVRSVDEESKIVEQWLYDMELRSAIHLCITLEERIVGLISAHQIDWMNQRTSIGYWIKSDMVNKNIVTESTANLMEYLFRKLRIHRIYIQAATDNIASNRVIKKLGFKFEGLLRENERLGDRFVDHNIYGMTSDDYNFARRQLADYFPE